MARRVRPPEDIGGLPARPDHVDAYVADRPDADRRTARAWVDAILDAAGPVALARIRAAQRAMGLRLVDPDPPNIALGWRVLDERPDRLVLGVEGRLYTPRVVFALRDGALLLTTAVTHHGRFGHLVWALGSPLHRLTARTLATAAERIDR